MIYGYHPIDRWRFRHIPGPPIRWLVGGLPEIAARGLAEAYAEWASQYAKDGVFKVFWGGYGHVVVVDPELMRRAFTSSSRKYDVPLLLPSKDDQEMFNNNMLFANGQKWKEMRNVWTPFFTRTKLEAYFPAMLRSIDRLEHHLDIAAAHQGQSIDLWPVLGSLTFDVIATAAAGLNIETLNSGELLKGGVNGLSAPTSSLRNAEKGSAAMSADKNSSKDGKLASNLTTAMRQNIKAVDMGSLVGLVFILPGLVWVPRIIARLMPPAGLREAVQARGFMTKTYSKLVLAARKQHQGLFTEVTVDPESFLSTVAAVKDKNTGELKPVIWPTMQSHLFLIAGYETTANTLTYCVYFLSANPDKEAKVLEEVDAFGRDRVPTSVADLDELPYLRAVLDESLRLIPPAPFSIREAKSDLQLGPYTIKKGSRLQSFMYGMHHSEKYWDKPEEFVPERFIAGSPESKSVKPGALMPFGEVRVFLINFFIQIKLLLPPILFLIEN